MSVDLYGSGEAHTDGRVHTDDCVGGTVMESLEFGKVSKMAC